MAPCSDLQKPASPSEPDVVAWAVDTVTKFNDCADRQEELASAIAKAKAKDTAREAAKK